MQQGGGAGRSHTDIAAAPDGEFRNRSAIAHPCASAVLLHLDFHAGGHVVVAGRAVNHEAEITRMAVRVTVVTHENIFADFVIIRHDGWRGKRAARAAGIEQHV